VSRAILSLHNFLSFPSISLPVADGATEFPTWNYTVTDTAPVWAYVCSRLPYLDEGILTASHSVAKKLPPAIAVLEWFCEWHLSFAEVTTSLNVRFSAINSDESSGRNFAAFQNVAKALNGTAAAASAPATPAAGSGANSVRMGGISISLVFAAVIGSLL
jgi:hypothetical protein